MSVRFRLLLGLLLWVSVVSSTGCGLLLDFGPPDPDADSMPQDGAAGCTDDADCDDAISCTRDRCEGGVCTWEARDDYCDVVSVYPCESMVCLPELNTAGADGCVKVPFHDRCDRRGDCGEAYCAASALGGTTPTLTANGCAITPTACPSTAQYCLTTDDGLVLSGTCTNFESCEVQCGETGNPCLGTLTCASSICTTDAISPCPTPNDPCMRSLCSPGATVDTYACVEVHTLDCFGL